MTQIKKLGDGSVFYGVPEGAAVPLAYIGVNPSQPINAEPAVDASYQKPIGHNRWGSQLIYKGHLYKSDDPTDYYFGLMGGSPWFFAMRSPFHPDWLTKGLQIAHQAVPGFSNDNNQGWDFHYPFPAQASGYLQPKVPSSTPAMQQMPGKLLQLTVNGLDTGGQTPQEQVGGKVARFGDWSAEVIWRDATNPQKTMTVWMAEGSPYVYGQATGGAFEAHIPHQGVGGDPNIYDHLEVFGLYSTASGAYLAQPTPEQLTNSQQYNIWGLRLNKNGTPGPNHATPDLAGTSVYYVLAAPAGAAWTLQTSNPEYVISSELNGSNPGSQGYFAIAALPIYTETPDSNTLQELLTLFAQQAFVFVTDTVFHQPVYNEAAATVTALYELVTKVIEGSATVPLYTLYPHLAAHTPDATPVQPSYPYRSPRGALSLIQSSTWQTTFDWDGYIPILPDTTQLPNGCDPQKLSDLLNQDTDPSYSLITNAVGPYYPSVQATWRIANLSAVAQQIKHPKASYFLDQAQSSLERWLTIDYPAGVDTAIPIGPTQITLFANQDAQAQNIQLSTEQDPLGYSPVWKLPGTTDPTQYPYLELENVDFGNMPFNNGSNQYIGIRFKIESQTNTAGHFLVYRDQRDPDHMILAGPNFACWPPQDWPTAPNPAGAQTQHLLLDLNKVQPGVHTLYIEWVNGQPCNSTAENPADAYISGVMIGDGTRRQYLYYDPTWNSLLPHPESYGMALNLNDHHFGNGYLLHAAAIVGQYAPLINNQPWSDPNRYGQAVDLLHQETVTLRGNASDPDLIFSPLKYFDPFAGHGWADGNGFVADGNDEESASEGLNHAAGVMHWGAAKGDTGLRDLGIFMSASYREAIHAYWFDIDRQNFPDSQQLGTAPRFFQVFQDGVKYATYFGADPESYLAIECIPGSPETLLHYAGSADVIQKLLDPVAQDYLGGRSIDQVRPPKYASPVLMFLALKDPAAALKAFEAIADNNQWESSNNQDNEWSFTIPYHFIAGLNALGLPDPSVKSTNHPFFRVFLKDNVRTYAAYNPTSVPIDVHFSDGTTVTAISGEVTMLQKSIAAKPE